MFCLVNAGLELGVLFPQDRSQKAQVSFQLKAQSCVQGLQIFLPLCEERALLCSGCCCVMPAASAPSGAGLRMPLSSEQGGSGMSQGLEVRTGLCLFSHPFAGVEAGRVTDPQEVLCILGLLLLIVKNCSKL